MALKGITVLELAGLAPSQYCGKVLADFGARIIRIDKTGQLLPQEELLGNGKQSVSINLKTPEGIRVFKRISSNADVLIEPFRAGVMERIGLGPTELFKENERLIYARLSGYGQEGGMSHSAGHDINFLSLSGILSMLGWRGKAPTPPNNLLADFGGGGLLCAFGIVTALFERTKSGKGQIVDHSIMRGSSYLASWMFASKDALWPGGRGENLLDGGAYMYDVYETQDGKWMAVGALEKKFYDNLIYGLGLSENECTYFSNNGHSVLEKKFKEKTQKEWTEIFKEYDACVTPVLSYEEAINLRPYDFQTSNHGNLPMPMPEPRLSRSKNAPSSTKPMPYQGEQTNSFLLEVGYSREEINQLAKDGIIHIAIPAKL